jgi:hypothetical protein
MYILHLDSTYRVQCTSANVLPVAGLGDGEAPLGSHSRSHRKICRAKLAMWYVGQRAPSDIACYQWRRMSIHHADPGPF